MVLMAQQCNDVVLLLPDRLDSNSSVDDWVSHFDCVVAINGWNEAEKLLWLQAHVIGKAHVACHHKTKNSYMLI